jgi:hypothetical protein
VDSIGVRVIEWMTAHALLLSGIDGRERLASHDVLDLRHRLKVGRIDAGTIATEMVELASVWDRADDEFVKDSVGIA